jgi:hypothetical protein
MPRQRFTFTLEVDVFDPEALASASRERALADNITLEDWICTRESGEDQEAYDLAMLLDPSTLPGCQILNHTVERLDDEEGA